MNVAPFERAFSDVTDTSLPDQELFLSNWSSRLAEPEQPVVTARARSREELHRLQEDLRRAGYRKIK